MLRRGNGEPELNTDEVMAKSNDLSEMVSLLTTESTGSFFDWTPVLNKLVPTMGINDTKARAVAKLPTSNKVVTQVPRKAKKPKAA